MTKRSRLLALSVLLSVAAPSVSSAEPPAPEVPTESANDAFARGQKLAQENKLAEAEAAFEIAWAQRKAWDIAGNLGLVEAGLGKWAESAEHLDFALQNLGALAKPEQREALNQKLEQARGQCTQLDLEATEGAEVKVGDRVYGKAPLGQALFLPPGQHTIIVTRLGFLPNEQVFEAKPGGLRKLTITLVADTSGGGGGEGPGGGRPSWPGWLMGGVGLATAGVGGALIGIGQGNKSDAEDIGSSIRAAGGSCEPATGPSSEQCAEVTDSADSAGTLSSAGIALAATGGALLVAGIIYLAIPNNSAHESAFLLPVVGPDHAGFLFGGSF